MSRFASSSPSSVFNGPTVLALVASCAVTPASEKKPGSPLPPKRYVGDYDDGPAPTSSSAIASVAPLAGYRDASTE